MLPEFYASQNSQGFPVCNVALNVKLALSRPG